MRRRFDTSHAKTFQNMYSIFIPRVITELRMNITRNGRSQEILLEYLKIGIKWKFAFFMFHPPGACDCAQNDIHEAIVGTDLV